MNTPSHLGNGNRPDVLPGYVLSKPPMLAALDVEEEMNRRLEVRYVDVHTRERPDNFENAAKEAAAIVATRPFYTYSKEFCRGIYLDHKLTPHLLIACLERNHGAVSLATARAILAESDDTFWRVRDACLDLFGINSKNGFAVADSETNPGATAST